MNYRRISFYRSHNLEVLGSSPSWPTKKKVVTLVVTTFFSCATSRLQAVAFVCFYPLLRYLFHYCFSATEMALGINSALHGDERYK